MPIFGYESYAARTPDEVRASIRDHGVAVVPALLDDRECAALDAGVWDFFEQITSGWTTPIRRDDPASWRGLWDLYPLHSMLVQHWGVGHAQVCWDARQNPKLAGVFAQFWGVAPDDLVVSFDALSMSPPPEVTKRGWYRGNLWMHSDQSFKRNGFEMLQSWVTAHDVDEGDATLSLLEGSHRLHAACQEKFDLQSAADWHKLSAEQLQYYLDAG